MSSPRPNYSVEYHIAQIAYFDDNQQLPPGCDYFQIWSGLTCFGKQRMSGRFLRSSELDSALPAELASYMKMKRFELGHPDAFESTRSPGGEIVLGGGICQNSGALRPTQDCDLYLTLGGASHCRHGSTLPFFQLAISNEWARAVGMESMLVLLKKNFEILDHSRPTYGFVDIATPEETFAGCAYTSPWYARLPLHRYEQGRWIESTTNKRDEARNVFWGNYFGTRLLAKVGGREQFLQGCREATRLIDGTVSSLIWEFENGVFIGLSKNPLNCRPGEILDVTDMVNSEWLLGVLTKHHALLGG